MSQIVDKIFNDFNDLKVLIIGDVMIDAYYFGKVDRISPEAPVPVVAVEKKENRLGGAANVALNVQALGATPILCAVIGDYADADDFDELLAKQNITNKGIIRSKDRITTVKTRVIGNNHQMMRIDSEVVTDINTEEQQELLNRVKQYLNEVDAIIFEDYDKGVITPQIINQVVAWAREKNIPTIVDPKKKNFLAYKGVTLFKPNLKEIKEGLKTDANLKNIDNLKKAIAELKEKLNNKMAMVTLSEDGVIITNHTEHYHITAHIRDISDVSGAGDTVVSVAALCLALNLPIKIIAEIANLAGGLVCETVGVVPISKERLYREALMLNLDAVIAS